MTDAIVTDRLRLEPIDVEQARAVVAGDRTPYRYGDGWPTDQSVEGLELEIARGVSPARWLVLRDGLVIGDIGWKGGPSKAGTVEIGYALAPPYRGQRYASEAVAAFVRWLLDRPEVQRVVADTRTDNVASQRALAGAGLVVVGGAEGVLYWLRDTAS